MTATRTICLDFPKKTEKQTPRRGGAPPRMSRKVEFREAESAAEVPEHVG